MGKKNTNALVDSFATLQSLAKQAAQSPAAPNSPAPGPVLQVVGSTPPSGEAALQTDAGNDSFPDSTATSISGRASPSGVAGYDAYDPQRTYVAGDRVMLPLNLFLPNPRNPRVFTFDADMNALVANLAANGQLECAQVYPPNAEGKFKGKGGHRRWLGLQTLNQDYMKVEIVAPNVNELEAYKQARALNTEHQLPTHIDDALRWTELLKEGAAPDQTALARALNINEGEMSKSLSLAEMPRMLLEPMAERIESFGLTSAYYVYRYWEKVSRDEEKTLSLIKKVIEGRLSVRALQALVRDITPKTAAPGRREHALARSVWTGPGQGELKSYATGKLTMELTKLDPETRDEVYARMTEVLREMGLMDESSSLQDKATGST